MGHAHFRVGGKPHHGFHGSREAASPSAGQIAGRKRPVARSHHDKRFDTDTEWKAGRVQERTLGFLCTRRNADDPPEEVAPITEQLTLPTRDLRRTQFPEKYAKRTREHGTPRFLYAVNASRDYDPSPRLESITGGFPPLWQVELSPMISSNPTETRHRRKEIKRVKDGHFVLLPESDQTKTRHATPWAALGQQYLGNAGTLSQPWDVVTGPKGLRPVECKSRPVGKELKATKDELP